MNSAFEFGAKAAAVTQGVPVEDLAFASGIAQGLRTPEAVKMARMVAGLAADALNASGRGHTLTAHIYGQLAKRASWDESAFEIVAPVYRALASLAALHFDECVEKKAGLMDLVNEIPSIFGGGIDKALELSALGGAGVGSLYWGANRHIKADDAEAESLHSRAKYYNHLSQQIEQELGNNTPPALRDSVGAQAQGAIA